MPDIVEAPNGTLWEIEAVCDGVATLRRFAHERTMRVSEYELEVANWRAL